MPPRDRRFCGAFSYKPAAYQDWFAIVTPLGPQVWLLGVQTSLLIDSIVRQTTVLIAQLSTTSGLRAPLAHVANQVFLDLVSELEGQGVGRKVIADMFGLALRSYQQKVQRLQESATDRGTTLWEAILAYIQEHKTASRTQVLSRFSRDDSATVRGVLNDLVGSALVYRTGGGDGTVYRAAQADEVQEALSSQGRAAKSAVVWVTVYRDGPISTKLLLERLRLKPAELQGALEQLLGEGHIQKIGSSEAPLYRAESCLIPLEQAAGWEAAVLDHFQAMVSAVCGKLAVVAGQNGALPTVGGSTFTFDVWPGHPHYQQVSSLLEQTRQELSSLWDAVHAHNTQAANPPTEPGSPRPCDRVTFYFGQNVRSDVSSIE